LRRRRTGAHFSPPASAPVSPRGAPRPSARLAADASSTRSTIQAKPIGWKRSRRNAAPSSSGSRMPAWGGEASLAPPRKQAGASVLAHLGFLGQSRSPYEDTRFRGLDLFGFPWILSFEYSLINGLHRKNEQRFFSSLLPLASERGNRRAIWFWLVEGHINHAASLAQFLIFGKILLRELCRSGRISL
jgi:hypothetical protein